MPLIKRAIEPQELSKQPLAADTGNPLECVANNTLSNVIRQLSSLSKHAEDLFQELALETRTLYSRSVLLQSRVERLQTKVLQLDATGEEVSLQDIHLRKPFRSSQKTDQQVVSRSSLPVAVVERYQAADPAPALSKLNKYRDDGQDCLKFYTDPGYFAQLWLDDNRKEQAVLKKKLRNKHKQPSGNDKEKLEPIRQPKKTSNQHLAKGKEFVEGGGGRNIGDDHVMSPQHINISYPSPQQQQAHAGGYAQGHPGSQQQQHLSNGPARASPVRGQSFHQQIGDLRISSADPPPVEASPVQPSHYFSREELMRDRGSSPNNGQVPRGMSKVYSRPNVAPPAPPTSQSQERFPSPPPPPPVPQDHPPAPPPAPPVAHKPASGYIPPAPAVMQTPPRPQNFASGSPPGHHHLNTSRDSAELPPPPPPLEGSYHQDVSLPLPPTPPPIYQEDHSHAILPPPPLPNFANGGDNVSIGSTESASTNSNFETMQPVPPAPVKEDSRSELLNAIVKGINLRKVEERQIKSQERRPTIGGLDVASIMDRAVELRRRAIEESDSESDDAWEEED